MSRKGDGSRHPRWFKLKIERRELVKKLPSESAVEVLLACFDYLETQEYPILPPLEDIAFSAIMPDLEEAWGLYVKRVNRLGRGEVPSPSPQKLEK